VHQQDQRKSTGKKATQRMLMKLIEVNFTDMFTCSFCADILAPKNYKGQRPRQVESRPVMKIKAKHNKNKNKIGKQ